MSIFSPFSSGFGSLSTYFSPTSANSISLHPSVVSAIKSLEKRTDVETRGIARGRGKERKARTPRRGGVVEDQVDFVQDLTTPFLAEPQPPSRGHDIGHMFNRMDSIDYREGKSILGDPGPIGILDEIPCMSEGDNMKDIDLQPTGQRPDSNKKSKELIIKKGSKDDLYVGKSLIFASTSSSSRRAGCVDFEGLSPRGNDVSVNGRAHSDDDDDNDDEGDDEDDEEEEEEGESQCTRESDLRGTKEDKDEEEEEEEEEGQALYPNILFTQTEILGLRLMFSLFDRYDTIQYDLI
jgi:hypothetical protein